jgi:hypothetical protein
MNMCRHFFVYVHVAGGNYIMIVVAVRDEG